MDTTVKPHPTREIPEKYAHIVGWGADLDHANRPAYPMERKPQRLDVSHVHAPVQQVRSVEVLVSNERPAITPLFGATVPPSGVSGSIRRAAFRFSENDIRHWMMLLFADRANMVEGLGSDLRRGRVPNIFAEMGAKSEFKYNRSGAIKKVLIAAAVVGVIGVVLTARRRHRERLF